MRFAPRRAAVLTAVSFVLAGCGGGGGGPATGIPPQSRSASSVQTAVVETESVATQTRGTGTLYIAATGSVYAVPLAADGPTTAQRTITPHPTENNHLITDVATNADGTLAILERYFDAAGQHCRIVVEHAHANGSPRAKDYQCDPSDQTQSEQISRNHRGGFDVLITDVTTGKDEIRRYGHDGATVLDTLILDTYPIYLATDKAGDDYLDNSGGEFWYYTGQNTDPSQKMDDTTVSAPNGLKQMAVAPDHTLYVVNGTLGSETIQVFGPVNGATGGILTRTIGPFTDLYISGMAVDARGELYVALDPVSNAGAAVVAVYDAGANGAPAPLRTITVQPNTNYIRGISIYQHGR